MTAPQPSDEHLLPDADWAAVVAQAEIEGRRIAAATPADESTADDELHPGPRMVPQQRLTSGALPLSGVVQAPGNGGRRKRGAPTFGVLHSAETPLRAGYAASIAKYFTTVDTKSCHYMTDPAETWGVCDDALIAWHCGTGNTNSLAVEQAGYARFSRAEWLTPDGWAQMRRNAAIMRAARDRYGIGLYWMTDQQLRNAHAGRIVGGWATHDQCRRVLGGTTHTDPMPHFPLAEQMALANGTDPQEDDMPTAQDVADAVVARLLQANHRTVGDTLLHLEEMLSAVASRNPWDNPVSWAIADRPMGSKPGTFDTPPLWQVLLTTQAEVAALRTTVQTLAEAHGGELDVDALMARIDATVTSAMEKTVHVEVSVDDHPVA